MRIGKIKWLLAVFVLAAIGTIGWTRPHWWLATPSTTIKYDGQLSSSRLYQDAKGEMILELQEESNLPYWIVPGKKKVFLANASNFVFLPFAAFVIHTNQHGVDLSYTAKTDVEPNITTGESSIEFTGLRHKRIEISW